mmetsp:Transcript_16194/g.33105  ORF Transcript_16194/g.33105 Transcript_16194/m.33105 type:complete len:84 (-) Transcript_16194:3193-3444(-)
MGPRLFINAQNFKRAGKFYKIRSCQVNLLFVKTSGNIAVNNALKSIFIASDWRHHAIRVQHKYLWRYGLGNSFFGFDDVPVVQ